jgi:hypothetical protein
MEPRWIPRLFKSRARGTGLKTRHYDQKRNFKANWTRRPGWDV